MALARGWSMSSRALSAASDKPVRFGQFDQAVPYILHRRSRTPHQLLPLTAHLAVTWPALGELRFGRYVREHTQPTSLRLFDDWFDPIEDMIRGQVRGLIEEMIRGELDATLSRPRYGRLSGHSEGSDLTAVVTGHRHGSRVTRRPRRRPSCPCPRGRRRDSDRRSVLRSLDR
jgi:hypothetical protein